MLRHALFPEGHRNPKCVGQPAKVIADIAGFSNKVNEENNVLLVECQNTSRKETLMYEKLSPVLTVIRATDFEDSLNKAEFVLR